MKLERGIKNLIYLVFAQVVTIALGLIVPRLILLNYGSETNGFMSTVGNIYAYLALLEAGIGTASIQALYKPVVNDDKASINAILAATKKYYRKCAYIYFAAMTAVSLLLPLILDTSLSYLTMSLFIFVEGSIAVINFYFLSTLSVMFSVEGKNYIKSNIALISTILSNVAKIVLVNLKANIVFLQVAYLGISLIALAINLILFKKHYGWVDLSVPPNFDALKHRKYFVIHRIAGIVFNNIDVILISVFCSLSVASVYAIYAMVMRYVSSIVVAVFSGLDFALGQTYNEDREKYIKLHDAYKACQLPFIFAILTTCFYMFTPFINLYTAGVTDIQYVDKYLPFLFCFISLLSGCRSVEGALINIAEHAKQTTWQTIVEAIINLILSVVLVQFIGIYGVLLGTVIALLYRTTDMIIYTNKKILNRSPLKTLMITIINFFVFAVALVIYYFINLNIVNYWQFILFGFILLIIFFIVYYLINFMVDVKSYKYIKGILITKLKARRTKHD